MAKLNKTNKMNGEHNIYQCLKCYCELVSVTHYNHDEITVIPLSWLLDLSWYNNNLWNTMFSLWPFLSVIAYASSVLAFASRLQPYCQISGFIWNHWIWVIWVTVSCTAVAESTHWLQWWDLYAEQSRPENVTLAKWSPGIHCDQSHAVMSLQCSKQIHKQIFYWSPPSYVLQYKTFKACKFIFITFLLPNTV